MPTIPLTPAQTAAQKRPQPIMPTLVPPPLPPPTEKWSFRNIRGGKDVLKAAINNARLIDPATRKPGNIPLDPAIIGYLLWVIAQLDDNGIYVMDSHVHAANSGEWLEHLHIKKWA